MELNIKVLKVTLPASKNEALALLKTDVLPVLKPSWRPEEVVCEQLVTGYCNTTLVVSLPDDVTKDDAIVVRIYGNKGDVHESRDLEFVKMQVGYYAGCFREVLASFENGCIYRYAPGRCLTSEELHQPHIIRECARLLARFQYIDLASLPLVNRKGERFIPEIRKDYYLRKVKDYLQTTADDLTNLDGKTRELSEQFSAEYEPEVRYMETFLSDLDLPLANCHMSFHQNNILYDECSGRVFFVDYEYSGYGNIAMFDYGYIFSMYRFAAHTTSIDLAAAGESEETKMQWLKIYLESKHQTEGRATNDVTASEMEIWKVLLDMMDVLTWLSVAGRWHHCKTLIPLDTKQMSVIALQVYKETKHKLPALREKYLRLTPQP